MAARKNSLSIDFSNFSDLAEQLDELGADLPAIFGEAMEEAAKTVEEDIIEAVHDANLPAQGKYSTGETEASIIHGAKATWSGSVGEIPIGFDKTKPGAGGWLITGTPKMRPDYALENIFSRKGYERKILEQIRKRLQKELDSRIGGVRWKTS